MARSVVSKWPKTESVAKYDTFRKQHFKDSERNAATPAEKRSDETPEAMNERSRAECIHLRRICHADVGATVFCDARTQ